MKKGGREEEKEYRKRMVVPLWSHMTNLCLLRGVRAAGQSHPSLSLHPSLSVSLSPSNTCICWWAKADCMHVFLRECCCQFLRFGSVRIHMRWLHALLLTERHLLSLTMSLLCCFSFRDYGSKRKSGKSPVFLNYPSLKLTSPSFFCQLVALNRTTP